MKIAWFTPFAKQSAIGYYSKLATEAIQKQYDVDIWVSNRDGDDLYFSKLNIIRYVPDNKLEELLALIELSFMYDNGMWLDHEKKRIRKELMHTDFQEADIVGNATKDLIVNKYNAESYSDKFDQFIQSLVKKKSLEKLIDKVIGELYNFGIHSKEMKIIDELVNMADVFLHE